MITAIHGSLLLPPDRIIHSLGLGAGRPLHSHLIGRALRHSPDPEFLVFFRSLGLCNLLLADFLVALALHPPLILNVIDVVLLLLLDVFHDLEELRFGLIGLDQGRLQVRDAWRRFHEILLPVQGRLIDLDNHTCFLLGINRSIFSRGRGNFSLLVECEQILSARRLKARVLADHFRLEFAYRLLKLLHVQVVKTRCDDRPATGSIRRTGLCGVLLRMRISRALLVSLCLSISFLLLFRQVASVQHQELLVGLINLACVIRITIFRTRKDRILVIEHIPYILLDKQLVHAPQFVFILIIGRPPCLLNHGLVHLVNLVLVERAFDAVDYTILLWALVLLDQLIGQLLFDLFCPSERLLLGVLLVSDVLQLVV